MDTYFQDTHGLPTEVARLIFQFSTLVIEIRGVQLYHPGRRVYPLNSAFFRNWEYIRDQVNENGELVVRDSQGRVRLIYIM